MSTPYWTSKPSILKQLSGLTKGTIFWLDTSSLRVDSDSLVLQPIQQCLWVNKQCNFVLTEWHLAIFDFNCEGNACIHEQFPSQIAKCWSNVFRFCIGKHTFSMEQTRKLKIQVQHVHWGEITNLVLVSAKPLESNIDMVLVRVDGLSHTVISPCQWTNKTGWICCYWLAAIYCSNSAWTKRMSTDDPIRWSLPQHVTTL